MLTAVQAVERAGLKVARVDLSTLAALRSIADEHLSVEAVIDLGAHLTSIVIHNQGVPKVVRTIGRGGQELTDKLADKVGLSMQEAEQAKHANGLSNGRNEITIALNEAVRPLLAEIRSSIHYFSSANSGAVLERISLTGGASALLGFADELAEQIGVPTNVVAPMQHIRNRWASKQVQQEESDGWATAVSVGLAMGAAA